MVDGVAEKLLELWKRHRPSLQGGIGDDWLTVDSLSIPLDSLWHDLFFRQAPRLQEKHYYGMPTPILFDKALSRVVLKVGGVLFVWFPDTLDRELDIFMRVPPGLPLQAIVARLETSNTPFPETLMESPVWSVPVKELWEWEVEVLGRNRWAELRDRGGDVHSDWLHIPENRIAAS